ncbi:winged helix-turn-helix transcriptional regulator [uncultured Enterovirga sp.]|uniref:winged helix-turn-helix transcriptional regulator n=1 Tax=uncultured Enterovirga sp. TaxID=2026352 RepID=UPI0035CC19F0
MGRSRPAGAATSPARERRRSSRPQHLRELKRDGVVRRMVHAEVPPRVDYILTPAGQGLRPALEALLSWGVEHVRLKESGKEGVA